MTQLDGYGERAIRELSVDSSTRPLARAMVSSGQSFSWTSRWARGCHCANRGTVRASRPIDRAPAHHHHVRMTRKKRSSCLPIAERAGRIVQIAPARTLRTAVDTFRAVSRRAPARGHRRRAGGRAVHARRPGLAQAREGRAPLTGAGGPPRLISPRRSGAGGRFASALRRTRLSWRLVAVRLTLRASELWSRRLAVNERARRRKIGGSERDLDLRCILTVLQMSSCEEKRMLYRSRCFVVDGRSRSPRPSFGPAQGRPLTRVRGRCAERAREEHYARSFAS